MCCKIQTASLGPGDVEGLGFWCGELQGFGPVLALSSERNLESLGCSALCQENCYSNHLL